MRVVIGSVVRGFALKSAVGQYLERNGHEVLDVGCYDTVAFAKFTSIAERAAKVLQDGEADLGILCCGTGAGMALAAGKFKGISAVPCETPIAAEFARTVNDANVLCMGESLTAPDVALRIVEAFLRYRFQDAPAVPVEIREFWADARDEILPKGIEAKHREIETL